MVADMPRLSSTGLRVPQLAEQREVLHVARADLEMSGVAADQLDLADVHHLGDDRQVVARAARRSICRPSSPSPWKL